MEIVTEPETLAELIADCAEIPRPDVPAVREGTSAESWTVSDACHAQVADLDAYR
ncbi:hypothetical protein ACFS2C_12080 [Prauserella oleivorans]|uniref:Uncharacterized protein n=1 Tax=Prauserella oleivorans TaxID=1478153 RepID=A0ABW5W9D0_9PSEU